MALQYSPKITTDGLVMCLDASNNKSYPTTDLPVKNGLVMWMDASDDTTFSYSSGTTVSQWRDKSGLNYHMVPVSAGPTRNAFLNSKKVLAFTNTQDIQNLSIDLRTSAYSVFVVDRYTSPSSGTGRILTSNSGLNNWLLGHWASEVNKYYANGWIYSTYVALDTNWKLYLGDWGGPSNDLANFYGAGTAIATNSADAAAGPWGLGINANSGERSNCEAAEIIVFNRLLSATERKQVHTYLGQKWGISNTDRSIIDLSGFNDNGLLGNGTVSNMPLFDYYNKGAFKFFASNKYIKLGNNTTINQFTGDFTVSLWAMAMAENSNYGNLIGDYYTFGVATTNEWQIMMNNSSAFLNVFRAGAGYIISNTASGFSANTWINVVLTRVGSAITLYANNTVIGTATYSSVFGSATGSVNIGIDGNNVAEPFSGLISNVLIYQKGLSAVEVAQNYEAQKSKFANTIVQQGLVLNLDAGNPYSYAGAGSAWYDVSGNNLIFNSQGTTQTPFTTIGGSPCFDFNGSGYWECGTNFNLVDLGGDCTIIIWFYCETTAVRRTIFEKAGTSYQSYQQEIAVTWETANDFSYYSRFNPSYDYASTAASTVNAWNMVGIKMSTGKTTAARTGFYSKNGSAWSASYNSQSNVALVAAGAIRIGSGYAGTVTDGYIGSVLCYNRMLTDAEILQNYNATKGRFGL